MPDEGIMAIAMVLTGIFSFFFYKYQKQRKTGKQKFIEKAKAQGSFTEGCCEDFKVRLGVEESSSPNFRNDSIKAKYRYTVNGRTYFKTMIFQNPGKITIDSPCKVVVYYDPRNPKKAVCPEEVTWAHRRQSGCLISIAATFLCLFCSFHLLRFLVRLMAG